MWLLVGGDSEIGAATYQVLTARGRAVAATTRRRERASADRPFLDLAAPLDDWAPSAGTQAACIFASIARLAACQVDPTDSAHVNVTQTLALIERLIGPGIYVLFLSTNQVFGGDTPIVAPDAPYCPVSEYGRQKARTEAALRRLMDQGAPLGILRLAKVVSPGMPLVTGWIDALSAGQPISAFDDMTMAPVPIDLVIEAITALLQDRARGVFQLTGPRDVTYAAVGHFLADRLGADPVLVTATSARSAGMPKGATPRHTTLDSSLLRERYGISAPDAWVVLEKIIAARKSVSHPAA